MDQRTTGIVATVASALICGCPGLFMLCFGAVAAGASYVPGADIDIFGRNEPRTALFAGLGALCLGVLFVAIPVLVGIFTLRERPVTEPEPVSDEPIPPPI
ncbi:MAG: hypothetical protein P8X95_25455 [Anaerolineales bacterium]|jgi:hypothetical protein